MKFLLDTHAAVWNAIDPARLSLNAKKAIGEKPAELLISDVTLSEVARLIVAGKISVKGDAVIWLSAFVAKLTVAPVNPKIAFSAAAYRFDHKDPYDRHILATAEIMRIPLLTVDKELTKAAKSIGVQVIW